MKVLPWGHIWPAEALRRFQEHYFGAFSKNFTETDRELFKKLKALADQIALLERPAPPRSIVGAPSGMPEATRTKILEINRRNFEALGGAEALDGLNERARAFQLMRDQSEAHLTWALGDGHVAATFVCTASGERFSARPALWYSALAPKIWAGQAITLDLGSGPWEGRVLVDGHSLDRLFAGLDETAAQRKAMEERAAKNDASLPFPMPDEDKGAFIMRALGMALPRRIDNAEGRRLAKVWLEAKNLPADPEAIDTEMNRMTSLMRALAPKEATKSAPAKAKPAAKS